MTKYETALHEFREASAAVRLAFSAKAEAREKQIIANTADTEATARLMAAQDRLDAADKALQLARAEPPTPAAIDATAGVVGGVTGGAGLSQGAAAVNPYAPTANGAVHDDLAIG